MKIPRWIPLLFSAAALYDALLGVGFILVPTYLFERFRVPPPNHVGYVQFPGALLVVFALMFVNIARDPIRNRTLIRYGILLKVAYCAVAGGHWLAGGIPEMWKPLVIADFIMAILFVWAYVVLTHQKAEA